MRCSALPVSATSATPWRTCPLGGRDQRLDLLGGLGRALGQRPHFGGDDGEAAAGVAGARRLDAGVERQQVGLERDLVDDADDLADLLRRLLDRAHRVDGLADDLARCAWRRVGAAPTSWRRVLGAVGRGAHGRGDFVERAAVSSRLAACCSVRRDRSSAAVEISREPEWMTSVARADARQRLFELADGGVEVGLQAAVALRQVVRDAVGQILGRQPRQAGAERGDRLLQLPTLVGVARFAGGAFGVERASRRLGFAVELELVDRREAEDFDRFGHRSHLVAAAASGHVELGLAGRQPAHRRGHAGDRPGVA